MKRKLLAGVVAALPLAIYALPAAVEASDSTAASNARKSPQIGLGEVEVVERVAKAPVTLLPLDVKIVDDATIERSAQTNVLPAVQTRVPGMFVTQRGIGGYGVSGGSAGAVSIRGVGGVGRVLFMIDGQPQWAGLFGHSLPDTYVSNDVERVEVVSGPSSLLYGSGAMGGSVNLITRRATHEGFEGSLQAMGGSYGTMKYGARAGYRHSRLRLYAAASYERTDGHRPGMAYWLANQYASASYEISNHWEAGADVMTTETRADNPGADTRQIPLDMWARQTRTTASIFVKNRYGRTEGGLQAYYNYGRHKIDDGLDRRNRPRTYFFHSTDYNTGFTLYQTVRPWEGNHLSLGVDFKHWGGRAYNASKTTGEETPIVEAHVNEIAGYAMMQQAFLDDRLSLNAGVRLEHSSQFGNQWVPQAGFTARPYPTGRVKFSYGRGFRSPNIRELYMYPPHNPDLLPEHLDNFELELRQWLLGGKLNIGLALYHIKGSNLIQTMATPEGRMLNINTGDFRNRGFEIDATWQIDRHWSATANYAYLHTDADLLAAPESKLFGEVAFRSGRWEADVDAMGIWRLHTETDTHSYGLLNARVAYTFPFRTPLTLFAKGENLTAARYEINAGFPMPKATVMAGVILRFN